jgi:hypothetical protein
MGDELAFYRRPLSIGKKSVTWSVGKKMVVLTDSLLCVPLQLLK